MEQFVLVPASMYNKKVITQSVTKQGLPKYQPSQNSTYQVDSLKREINKKLFSKANSLVDKILSCPGIKLSNSQPLILDGKETGISLLEFPQQLRQKITEVPDIYVTLLLLYFDGLYAHKSYFHNYFKGSISQYKGVLHCEVMTMKNFLMKISKHLCLNLFSQGE